jgi:hypothetical protein
MGKKEMTPEEKDALLRHFIEGFESFADAIPTVSEIKEAIDDGTIKPSEIDELKVVFDEALRKVKGYKRWLEGLEVVPEKRMAEHDERSSQES